jgi:DNA-binding response OmpR family regulator
MILKESRDSMTGLVPPARIILIENNPAVANSIRAALDSAGNGLFHVEWVRQCSEAITRLSQKDIDAILLDLCLPDSQGIATFDAVFLAAHGAPILILGSDVDEDLAK